ncbi:MAG: hypothetical protein AAFO07_24790 [Bacteroidota bacterium]
MKANLKILLDQDRLEDVVYYIQMYAEYDATEEQAEAVHNELYPIILDLQIDQVNKYLGKKTSFRQREIARERAKENLTVLIEKIPISWFMQQQGIDVRAFEKKFDLKKR